MKIINKEMVKQISEISDASTKLNSRICISCISEKSLK